MSELDAIQGRLNDIDKQPWHVREAILKAHGADDIRFLLSRVRELEAEKLAVEDASTEHEMQQARLEGQRDTVLALHNEYPKAHAVGEIRYRGSCDCCREEWPCATVRAYGVTE